MFSEDLMITAAHCVKNPDISRLFVAFNYKLDADGNVEKETQYKVEEILEVGGRYNLDYAILKIKDKPGAVYGFASLAGQDNELKIADEISIIQHPDGEPMQVDTGSLSYVSDVWLHYEDLDTLKGSSGSVILNTKGEIVGVHTQGGCYRERGANKGLNIKRIYESSSILK